MSAALLASSAVNAAADLQSASLITAQGMQSMQQTAQSFAMSSFNAQREHSQKLAGQVQETDRAIMNDQAKRSTEMQSDAAALIKDANQKLDSSASA